MPDPTMVTFSRDLSAHFVSVYEGAVQPPELDPSVSIIENVQRLDLAHGCPDRVAQFLDAIPPATAAAFIAAVATALHDRALVQVIWLPGYEFELTVSDVRREASMVGIVLRSPYAADVAPSETST
jgi:hypothetical protein